MAGSALKTADPIGADESWTMRRRYGHARLCVPSHGAPLRGRQLSARIISFFEEGARR